MALVCAFATPLVCTLIRDSIAQEQESLASIYMEVVAAHTNGDSTINNDKNNCCCNKDIGAGGRKKGGKKETQPLLN
eukprot:3078303-Ditylum_brightwellii.AAC.1